jgi:SAM-dependent methyltransferase
MSILDVGCGGGSLLGFLRRAGFGYLAGIDPYLPGDVEVLPGLVVRKLSMNLVQESFDLIMLHHVFEHLESGGTMLDLCRQRLRPGGKILLRFPTAESDAWEIYRELWVQLDAPRHLFLHTQASLKLLAGRAGLELQHWSCDSTAFQYWGSELYRRGLALFDRNGAAAKPEDFFTIAQMKTFAKKAKHANLAQRGDQIVAVLVAQATAQRLQGTR